MRINIILHLLSLLRHLIDLHGAIILALCLPMGFESHGKDRLPVFVSDVDMQTCLCNLHIPAKDN